MAIKATDLVPGDLLFVRADAIDHRWQPGYMVYCGATPLDMRFGSIHLFVDSGVFGASMWNFAGSSVGFAHIEHNAELVQHA